MPFFLRKGDGVNEPDLAVAFDKEELEPVELAVLTRVVAPAFELYYHAETGEAFTKTWAAGTVNTIFERVYHLLPFK